MTLSYDAYLDAIERNSQALLDAADADLDRPVPSCPGWTMGDLLLHVADVYTWVSGIIRDRAQEGRRRAAASPGIDATSYLADARVVVLDELRGVQPDEPVWNWADQPPCAQFWARRMAHETSVHRWDAENTDGGAQPIEPPLAADGVDEALRVTLPARLRYKPQHRLEGSLHLHATDVEGEWLVHISPDALDVTNEHAKADVAVRGLASDLLLTVYNRMTGVAEVFGDRALLDRWREGVRF